MNISDAFTVVGVLEGSSAYADAKTLAEDLVKSRAETGTPLQLDLSDLPQFGTYDVGVASGNALRLTYVPGARDLVGVQLTANRVQTTIGGSQTTRASQTPDSGSGIKIESADGNTTLELTPDLTVTRTVGRAQAKLNPRPADFPTYIDENDPAEDTFEISGELLSNADSDANDLETSIFGTRLGTSDLTLHFTDNLWGLDAYDVAPSGTQALRTVRNAGETGVVSVPKIALRVVDNT